MPSFRAAIYVRVSTEEQAKSGYSLPDQIRSCRERLFSLGITGATEYVDDGYSGEFLERPGLDKLRADLRASIIQAVIAYDPDRLSRNLTNQLLLADEIEKTESKLMFVTGDYDASPEGRLFFSIRGAISAFEKAKIRERTQRGKKAKAQQGKIIQNAKPYGYDWDRRNSTYIINEEEAKAVRLIYSLLLDHRLGTYRIMHELRRLGIMGKSGKPMAEKTVHNILTKEMYCGDYYQFREITQKTGQRSRKIEKNRRENQIRIEIPAIVSRETWKAAQQQLRRNATLAKRNTKHEYLLQGLVYCPLCGRKLIACHLNARRKKSAGKAYFYYSCIGAQASYAEKCPSRRIPAVILDSQLWSLLSRIAHEQEKLPDYLHSEAPNETADRIRRLADRHKDLAGQREKIVAWFRDRLIDSATANRQLLDLAAEMSEIADTLTALTNIQQTLSPEPAIALTGILQSATFAQKRAVLLELNYKIFANREKEKVTYWLSY